MNTMSNFVAGKSKVKPVDTGEFPTTYNGFAGGASDGNGKMYAAAAGGNTQILKIDSAISYDTKSLIGSLVTQSDKYKGGVLAPNGKIYIIPQRSSRFVVVDPSNDTVTETLYSGGSGSFKFSGAVLASNDKIYCCPRESTDILVIDTTNDTTSTIPFTAGYSGFVLSDDLNYIYAIPYTATDIKRLVIATGTMETVTGSIVGGSLAYMGGVLSKNGAIYGCPFGSNYLLKITHDPILANVTFTETDVSSIIGSSGSKYSTIFNGVDANLYFMPQNESEIIKVDTSNDSLSVAYTVQNSPLAAGKTNGMIYDALNRAVYGVERINTWAYYIVFAAFATQGFTDTQLEPPSPLSTIGSSDYNKYFNKSF